MQVNNAGVTGGKLVDGDALLRKVGFASLPIKTKIKRFSLFKFIPPLLCIKL